MRILSSAIWFDHQASAGAVGHEWSILWAKLNLKGTMGHESLFPKTSIPINQWTHSVDVTCSPWLKRWMIRQPEAMHMYCGMLSRSCDRRSRCSCVRNMHACLGGMARMIRGSADPLIRWSTDSLIRWSADPLIRWSADPLIRWWLGSRTRWSADPMIRWSADPLIRWSADPLIRWSDDPLIQWSADPLIRWSDDGWAAGPADPLIRWSDDPLIRWSADPMIRWSADPMMAGQQDDHEWENKRKQLEIWWKLLEKQWKSKEPNPVPKKKPT